MATSTDEIATYLNNVKFKRRIIGGVDEDDVWKTVERLNKEYAELYQTLQTKSEAYTDRWRGFAETLLKRQKKSDELIKRLNAEIIALKGSAVKLYE